MATQVGFINPNIQRQGAKSRALAAKRNVQDLPDPRTYGAFSGLLQENPYEVANQFSVFDPKRQQVLQAAESTYPIGALLNVAPAMEFLGINKLLGKVPRIVGQEIGAASMGQRPGGLLEQFIPQPLYAIPPGKKLPAKSLLEETPIVRTPEEQAVIDKFGQKQVQEKARAKKVEKMALESASMSPEAQAASTFKSKGKRQKVEADYYRKMAETSGDEAVLKNARGYSMVRKN